mgnify:CR=1 FL=1|jgi:hypothetical protein
MTIEGKIARIAELKRQRELIEEQENHRHDVLLELGVGLLLGLAATLGLAYVYLSAAGV